MTVSAVTGLASCLVQKKILSESAAAELATTARETRTTFINACICSRLIDHGVLAGVIGRIFGLPVLDLERYRPMTDLDYLVAPQIQRSGNVIPLSVRGNRLVLAVSDPSQMHTIREIEFHSGRHADLVISPHDQLNNVLESKARKQDPDNRLTETASKPGLESLYQSAEPKISAELEGINDAPVIRAVNRILQEAVRLNASDIHVEPYEKLFRIRIRVDGILRELTSPPIRTARRLISRLKILASLDISERRLPQDGRIKLTSPEASDVNTMDFRVSTLPTLWGEKLVLRVMDPARTCVPFEQLGLDRLQSTGVKNALARPQGLILVTGPTGSGKTVTLYSALTRLNSDSRNISTAEDPVELTVPGINQVQIRPAIGLDFATALRAFLRQDPDVVMVGEIRDAETAGIAVKAAQTGHLVLSTLHTNDAAQTIARLLNMGIEPYNLAASLSLVIAQRLARKLCKYCKKKAPLPTGSGFLAGLENSLPTGSQIYQATGCDRCHGGYAGRIGIYEVVPISEPLSRTIIAGGNSMDIADAARKAGHASLRQSALTRMTEGLTSLEEVTRVT